MTFGGILLCIIGGIVFLHLMSNAKEEREENEHEEEERRRRERESELEEERRVNTRCYFQDGFTEEEFRDIAKKIARQMTRVEFRYTNGMEINCTATSQSGASDWDFSVDFNNYGHYTGKCWIWAENEQSNLPHIYRKLVKQALDDKLLEKKYGTQSTKHSEQTRNTRKEEPKRTYDSQYNNFNRQAGNSTSNHGYRHEYKSENNSRNKKPGCVGSIIQSFIALVVLCVVGIIFFGILARI